MYAVNRLETSLTSFLIVISILFIPLLRGLLVWRGINSSTANQHGANGIYENVTSSHYPVRSKEKVYEKQFRDCVAVEVGNHHARCNAHHPICLMRWVHCICPPSSVHSPIQAPAAQL
ncbi:hypothetical protein F4814DRAFT_212589 [Daldinia grandis]|nr:hypothetical protein F4814DRAFT_212589 [Daldinia grandis]